MFKKWIAHKKYRIQYYGLLDAFIYEPFEDMVQIPCTKIWSIIRWIPTLWNLRDWEGTDVLKVMDYQLSRTQNVLQNDPHHQVSETDSTLTGPIYAKEIQEVRDAIHRIKNCDYCKEEWNAYNKKYGDKWNPINKKAEKERDRILELMEQREKVDYDKVFHDMRHKVQSWWS